MKMDITGKVFGKLTVGLRAKDIDTSSMYVGLADDLPMIEKRIRKLVAECIAGFLQDSISLEVQRRNGVDWVVVFMDVGKQERPVFAKKLEDLMENLNA